MEPWEVTKVTILRLSYEITMKGRKIKRGASAANIKLFHLRPAELRHDFGDEFAYLAWEADLGLASRQPQPRPYTL